MENSRNSPQKPHQLSQQLLTAQIEALLWVFLLVDGAIHDMRSSSKDALLPPPAKQVCNTVCIIMDPLRNSDMGLVF